MRLGDICTKIGSGATPRGGKESYKSSGIPIIRSQNVLDWSFKNDGLAFIDGKQAGALSNVEVLPGDVLLNITGDSVARACIVPVEQTPARVNQHVAIVRHGDRLNPTYLLAFLQNIKPHLLSLASSGATRKALTKSMIENLEIELPDIETQNRISSVINSVQQKIMLNTRLNGYLTALIAARFAEDFGDDCHTARLGDVLRISTKTAKPQDHAGEIWEHYSIPAFDESHRPVMEPANEIKSNKYIVSRNSILISKLNPSIKRFWLPACLTDHPVCSTEFIVFEPTRPENKSFYAAAISSNNFQNYLIVHVTGSTGSRQRVQPKSTLDFPMPNPSESAIRKFCSFADPIYAQMESCARESADLERLRDTLLPKLMSGEIDVSKVEVPTPPNSHLAEH